MSVPVWRAYGGQGTWDQATAEELIASKLWPLPAGLAFHVVEEPGPDFCGLVLAHGPVVNRHRQELRERLHRVAGALVLHTSDEGGEYDSSELRRANVRTWLHYPSPLRSIEHDRRMWIGYPPETPELVRPVLPGGLRLLTACYVGQAQNQDRLDVIAALADRPRCHVMRTGGFAQGDSRPVYLKKLATAAIAPCPAGNRSPDTMRLYEALEAGCLPIVQRSFPGWPEGWDFWDWVFGEGVPFPVVDSWAELPALLDRFEADEAALHVRMMQVRAWWLGQKRRYAQRMMDELRKVGCEMPSDKVTVLIPTSPIRAHPSLDGILQTISAVRSYDALREAEILIMVDGVRGEQSDMLPQYNAYRERLVEACSSMPELRGCLPLIFDEHTHQADMTRTALERVRTPLVFFVEHDTYPAGEIPFEDLIHVFDVDSQINYLRLSIYHDIRPEHVELMEDGGERREVAGVPLVRTRQWSQRPHLARTDFYRQLLSETIAPGSRTMIEDAVYGTIVGHPWERFGLAVYAPPGDMTRSFTWDGRGNDPKYSMVHMRPGDVQPRIIGGMPGKAG